MDMACHTGITQLQVTMSQCDADADDARSDAMFSMRAFLAAADVGAASLSAIAKSSSSSSAVAAAALLLSSPSSVAATQIQDSGLPRLHFSSSSSSSSITNWINHGNESALSGVCTSMMCMCMIVCVCVYVRACNV